MNTNRIARSGDDDDAQQSLKMAFELRYEDYRYTGPRHHVWQLEDGLWAIEFSTFGELEYGLHLLDVLDALYELYVTEYGYDREEARFLIIAFFEGDGHTLGELVNANWQACFPAHLHDERE